MDILNSDIELDDNITIDEAIARSIDKTNDPEFAYLVSEYRKLNDLWAFGYGASSNLSNKWSNNGDNISLNLRDASGTNSFSFRGVAYRDSYKSNNIAKEPNLPNITTSGDTCTDNVLKSTIFTSAKIG